MRPPRGPVRAAGRRAVRLPWRVRYPASARAGWRTVSWWPPSKPGDRPGAAPTLGLQPACGYQILARADQRRRTQGFARGPRGQSDMSPEGRAEVALMAEAQFAGECSEIVRAVGEAVERERDAQTRAVGDQAAAAGAVKQAGKMERRATGMGGKLGQAEGSGRIGQQHFLHLAKPTP